MSLNGQSLFYNSKNNTFLLANSWASTEGGQSDMRYLQAGGQILTRGRLRDVWQVRRDNSPRKIRQNSAKNSPKNSISVFYRFWTNWEANIPLTSGCPVYFKYSWSQDLCEFWYSKQAEYFNIWQKVFVVFILYIQHSVRFVRDYNNTVEQTAKNLVTLPLCKSIFFENKPKLANVEIVQQNSDSEE